MSSDPARIERYCATCEKSFLGLERCPDDGTELVVLGGGEDPLLGRNLNDRYTIQSRLGAGGMGTVYKGLQHSVGRDVAIKVVNPRLLHDQESTKRFLREAKLAGRFSHPNAVGMLDFGQTKDGLFFLVMELLEGKTLDQAMRDTGRFTLERVGTIAMQICDALEAAHRMQIVHRDLKPANVMLLEGERDLIKVLDFGLAKSLSPDTTSMTMTNSGALLGTPAYMSPEAALGNEVDARCDLYSLGVMLYVLGSGRLPFNAVHAHEMIAMQAHEEPPRPVGIPTDVADVIMTLLAKNPEERYPTAAATRAALSVAIAKAKAPDDFTASTTVPAPDTRVDLPIEVGATMLTGRTSSDDVTIPPMPSNPTLARRPNATPAAGSPMPRATAPALSMSPTTPFPTEIIAPRPWGRRIAGIGLVAVAAIVSAWFVVRHQSKPSARVESVVPVDAAPTIKMAPIVEPIEIPDAAPADAEPIDAAVEEHSVAPAIDAGVPVKKIHKAKTPW